MKTPSHAGDLEMFRRDPSVIVYEAIEPGDRMRIRREVEGRRWAAMHRIPTAETIAVGPGESWMASRRVVDDPGEPIAYLAAALELAERIQHLPEPRFETPGASWRAPRVTAVARAARLAVAGIGPRLFVTTRAAVAALRHDVTVHNDYQRHNVLNTRGEVTVVDWEYTATGPRHHDFVRLLVDVRDDGVARQGWELLLGRVGPGEHEALALQLRWLALRTYGSEICRPCAERRAERSAFRRRRWLQATEWTHGMAPCAGRR